MCTIIFLAKLQYFSFNIHLQRAPPKKSLRFKALLSNVKLTSSIVMMIQQMYRKKKLLVFRILWSFPLKINYKDQPQILFSKVLQLNNEKCKDIVHIVVGYFYWVVIVLSNTLPLYREYSSRERLINGYCAIVLWTALSMALRSCTSTCLANLLDMLIG